MANAFNNATSSLMAFWTGNQRTILIAVAVVVVLYVGYTMYYRSDSMSQYGGYPAGYQRYPGREGFYDDTMMDPSLMDPNQPAMEGFAVSPEHKRVVLCYAPWCPHCKDLIKDENSPWSQFERKHKGRPGVTIEKIDGDQNPEFTTKYSVGGYPSIKMFYKGKVLDYDGDRTLRSFDEFLENPPQ